VADHETFGQNARHARPGLRDSDVSSITLITGAPSAGKSTIAKLLARRSEECLVINVDELRGMMVAGFCTPVGGWTDRAYLQFQLARATTIYMAELYAGEGIDVIIDDPWVPDSFAEHYAALSGNRSFRRVLLMPSRATIIERIAKRGNPWDHVLINLIPRLYDYLEPMPKDGWIVLDSSTWSIPETLGEVISRLGLDSGTTQS
jgi:tRNA uridine 5-carbamoylmethylation protein Kti12